MFSHRTNVCRHGKPAIHEGISCVDLVLEQVACRIFSDIGVIVDDNAPEEILLDEQLCGTYQKSRQFDQELGCQLAIRG
jgi:hypothetical protein